LAAAVSNANSAQAKNRRREQVVHWHGLFLVSTNSINVLILLLAVTNHQRYSYTDYCNIISLSFAYR